MCALCGGVRASPWQRQHGGRGGHQAEGEALVVRRYVKTITLGSTAAAGTWRGKGKGAARGRSWDVGRGVGRGG